MIALYLLICLSNAFFCCLDSFIESWSATLWLLWNEIWCWTSTTHWHWLLSHALVHLWVVCGRLSDLGLVNCRLLLHWLVEIWVWIVVWNAWRRQKLLILIWYDWSWHHILLAVIGVLCLLHLILLKWICVIWIIWVATYWLSACFYTFQDIASFKHAVLSAFGPIFVEWSPNC